MKMLVLSILVGLLLASASTLPVQNNEENIQYILTFPHDIARDFPDTSDELDTSDASESALTPDWVTNYHNVTDGVFFAMENQTGNDTRLVTFTAEHEATSRLKRALQSDDDTTEKDPLSDSNTTPDSIFRESDSLDQEGLIDPKILENVVNMTNYFINQTKLSGVEVDFSKIFIRIGNGTLEKLYPQIIYPKLLDHISQISKFNQQQKEEIMRIVLTLNEAKRNMDLPDNLGLKFAFPKIEKNENGSSSSEDILDYEISSNSTDQEFQNFKDKATEKDSNSTSSTIIEDAVSIDTEILEKVIKMTNDAINNASFNESNLDLSKLFVHLALNDNTKLEKIEPKISHLESFNPFFRNSNFNQQQQEEIMSVALTLKKASETMDLSKDVRYYFAFPKLEISETVATSSYSPEDILEEVFVTETTETLLDGFTTTPDSISEPDFADDEEIVDPEILMNVIDMTNYYTKEKLIDDELDRYEIFIRVKLNNNTLLEKVDADFSSHPTLLDYISQNTNFTLQQQKEIIRVVLAMNQAKDTVDLSKVKLLYDAVPVEEHRTVTVIDSPSEDVLDYDNESTPESTDEIIENSTVLPTETSIDFEVDESENVTPETRMEEETEETGAEFTTVMEESTTISPILEDVTTSYLGIDSSTMKNLDVLPTESFQEYVTDDLEVENTISRTITEEPIEDLTTENPIETSDTIIDLIEESKTTEIPNMESFSPGLEPVEYSTTEMMNMKAFMQDHQLVEYSTTESPTVESSMSEPQISESSTAVPTLDPMTEEYSSTHSVKYSTTEIPGVESYIPEPRQREPVTTEISSVESSSPEFQISDDSTTEVSPVESTMPERQFVESSTTSTPTVQYLETTSIRSLDANHENEVLNNSTIRKPKLLQIVDSDLLGNETLSKNETALPVEFDFIQCTKNHFKSLTTIQTVCYIVAFSLTILIVIIVFVVKCRGTSLMLRKSKYRQALDQDAIAVGSNVVFGSIQRLNSSLLIEDNRPSRPPSFIPLEPMFPELAHNANGAMLLSSFSKSATTPPLPVDHTDSAPTPKPPSTCNDIMDFESDLSGIADKSSMEEKLNTPENVCENTINENSEMNKSEQETDVVAKPSKPSRIKNVTIISITTEGSDIVMKRECSNCSESEKSISGPNSVQMSRESLSSDERSTLPMEDLTSSADNLENHDSVGEQSDGPQEVFSINL